MLSGLVVEEIPSSTEDNISSPTSILRLRIDPVSGEDEGLAAKTFTSLNSLGLAFFVEKTCLPPILTA